MSEWTAPADLKAQVLRLWERDELLLATFPLRLTLRVPSSKALSARFDEARAWVAELQQGALQQGELQPKTGQGYRLVMREVRHPILGANSLPIRRSASSGVSTQASPGRLLAPRIGCRSSRITRR